MSELAFLLLNGLSYGLMLFMLAAGLTLILSLMGVLNFAHASFYMLGAYLGYQAGAWVGFWPSIVIAPLAVGLIGAGVERYGLRRVHAYGHAAELLFTFGLSLVIVEAVSLIWGRVALPYRAPAELDGPVLWLQSVIGVTFPRLRALLVVVALLMLAALRAIAKTRLGLVLRAARSHPEQLEAMGHNLPGLTTWLFGFGCALAALAGTVGGIVFVTEPGMAAAVAAIVFVVVALGGRGSVGGALAAALLLGVLDSVGKAVDVPIAAGVTVADLTPLAPFVLLIGVLLVRPNGLLGDSDA